LLVANGHVFPQMENLKGSGGYRQPLLLFRNQKNRAFRDVTALAGLDKLPLESRRGAAFGDVNNDGKVDVLLLNVGRPPTLLINRTESNNHAIMFQLVGTKSNRSAIGARITVHVGELVEMNEVRSGSSYCSQNDLRLHFGLSTHSAANNVEVWWPSGKTETFKDLAADFIYTIVEGKGVTGKTPFAKAAESAGIAGISLK
jgi:enediyne biosynthesis protein E4